MRCKRVSILPIFFFFSRDFCNAIFLITRNNTHSFPTRHNSRVLTFYRWLIRAVLLVGMVTNPLQEQPMDTSEGMTMSLLVSQTPSLVSTSAPVMSADVMQHQQHPDVAAAITRDAVATAPMPQLVPDEGIYCLIIRYDCANYNIV